MVGALLSTWHIITGEYPPQPGGVSDYTALLAPALEAAGQPVHVWCQQFEGFTKAGLTQVGRELDRYPKPGRILLQWVPHAFGAKSMNIAFCRWIAARPEPLEIMVHEPGLGFGEGGIRHDAVAAVHRLMTALLLRKAERVWISIPAWEPRLRPWAFGRSLPFTWLPVPSNISVSTTYTASSHPIGYFGQYDDRSRAVLGELMELLDLPVFLLGRGAERVVHKHATVAGDLSPEALSQAIQSCDIICHWYPDGVSSRRGTVMASLAHSRAVVANHGKFTEPIWRQSGAVKLSSDAHGMALHLTELLGNRAACKALGELGNRLYNEQFALSNTIRRLMELPR